LGAMALILIVDGDSVLSEVVQQRFQRQGHQALVAHTAHDALTLAERYSPDVVVLNTALPRFSASEIYQRLKATPGLNGKPVLFYSLHLQLAEDPDSLCHNGSSHIRRSCPLSEVTARANSLLRRGHHERTHGTADHLIAGKLVLHTRNLTVEINNRFSTLTPTEFELLRYLMLHVDEVCSARRLLQNVWGYPPGTGSTDVVRTHIRNLRQKIEQCPAQPVHLRTIRHCGYMLCSNAYDEGYNDEGITRVDTRKEKSPAFSRAVA